MADGNCHVGMIEANDGTFITITHKDWVSGFYWGTERTVRVDAICEVVHAGLAAGEWQDDHFGRIQSQWVNTFKPVGA